MKTKKESDIIEKLVDLHKQATEERSHYYVGSVIREATAEILALRIKLKDAQELYEANHG